MKSGVLMLSALAAFLFLRKKENGVIEAKGIRNNNPLNIRYNPANDWDGQIGADKDRFSIFSSPLYGIRAAAKIVDSYRERGIVTLQQIIETWAPSIENNTVAYVMHVAKKMGVEPDHVINRDEYPLLFKYMILHENGYQPYTEQTIIDGVALA